MKVAVAMSGGVDSSVSALLMKEAGHEVIGLTMTLWDPSGRSARWPGPVRPSSAVADAKRVADVLRIPHLEVDLSDAFQERVLEPFLSGYTKGETPSPCLLCNRFIKFGRLLAKARQEGAERLVTGHYVSKGLEPRGEFSLRKARDGAKDQSYFLAMVGRDVLASLEFPLGERVKQEVREIARRAQLPVAEKPESQELCFLEGSYVDFLEAAGRSLPAGEIMAPDGRVLGVHRGLHRYTLGQRKGLGVSWREPLYVTGLEVETHRLHVGPDEALMATTLEARDVNWLLSAPEPGVTLLSRIRYRAKEQPAKVWPLPDGRLRVSFDAPQRAITPGQAVVFYENDRVLGGAWIDRVLDPLGRRPV